MRKFWSREIRDEEFAPGLVRITALRLVNERLTRALHTAVFPYTFAVQRSDMKAIM